MEPKVSRNTHGHTSGSGADHAVDKRRWRTPPNIIASLQAEGGRFDLDAAASPGAEICRHYIAPPGYTRHEPPRDDEPIGVDCLNMRWRSLLPREGGRIWFNCPWGANLAAVAPCPPACRRKHDHVVVGRQAIPGTLEYVKKALKEAEDPGCQIVMLLPTAPDTKWWRLAYERSKEVRLLPRVEFLHPDTGVPMGAPPGCGVTLFFLGRAVRQPAVHLATKRGLRALPGVEVDDE